MQSPTESPGSFIAVCLLLILGLAAGCAAPSPGEPVRRVAQVPRGAQPAGPVSGIQTVSCQDATAPLSQQATMPAFENTSELSVETLVQEILARNPSLAQMAAAWQAASQRYPQVTSLEDPMFAATVGPGTIAPDDSSIEFAYRLEITQKLPFPGKLKLRGANALAEASATGRDIETVRLQLVESARTTFYDYYLVGRALAINDESLELLREFRKNAQTRYQTGLVSEQDVLQADVEIGREQDRRLQLEQMRQIAVARMNTLMHLPPDSPLPSPPQNVQLESALPDELAMR